MIVFDVQELNLFLENYTQQYPRWGIPEGGQYRKAVTVPGLDVPA